MRKNSFFSVDHDRTILKFESTIETSRTSKYHEVWKRALKKIKTQLIITRFMNLARQNPYVLTEEILESYLQSPNKKIHDTSKSCILLQHSSLYLIWLFLLFMSLVYLTVFSIFYSSFVKVKQTNLKPLLKYSVIWHGVKFFVQNWYLQILRRLKKTITIKDLFQLVKKKKTN